jgi:hypothetical protein
MPWRRSRLDLASGHWSPSVGTRPQEPSDGPRAPPRSSLPPPPRWLPLLPSRPHRRRRWRWHLRPPACCGPPRPASTQHRQDRQLAPTGEDQQQAQPSSVISRIPSPPLAAPTRSSLRRRLGPSMTWIRSRCPFPRANLPGKAPALPTPNPSIRLRPYHANMRSPRLREMCRVPSHRRSLHDSLGPTNASDAANPSACDPHRSACVDVRHVRGRRAGRPRATAR